MHVCGHTLTRTRTRTTRTRAHTHTHMRKTERKSLCCIAFCAQNPPLQTNMHMPVQSPTGTTSARADSTRLSTRAMRFCRGCILLVGPCLPPPTHNHKRTVPNWQDKLYWSHPGHQGMSVFACMTKGCGQEKPNIAPTSVRGVDMWWSCWGCEGFLHVHPHASTYVE
jgi:hypothetical protein